MLGIYKAIILLLADYRYLDLTRQIYVLGEHLVDNNTVIGQIWGGDLSEDGEQQGSPLAGLLGSLMDVPVVTLCSEAAMLRPIAMMEETEVLPGASLGDVLAEELSIEVPFGALVLIQPKGFAKSQDLSGQKLGEILGHIILDMSQGAHVATAPEGGIEHTLRDLAMGRQMVPAVKLPGIAASRLQ